MLRISDGWSSGTSRIGSGCRGSTAPGSRQRLGISERADSAGGLRLAAVFERCLDGYRESDQAKHGALSQPFASAAAVGSV